MRLTYAIKYVADMDKAAAFHRDTLGLPLAFASPFWTEFATGGTKLALHPATDTQPAGSVPRPLPRQRGRRNDRQRLASIAVLD